jgi:hypothetical protein
MNKSPSIYQLIVAVLLLAVTGGTMTVRLRGAGSAMSSVMGMKKVVAFTYVPTKDLDAKQLRSATFLGPVGPTDWEYWRRRNVVTGVGHTWFDLLRSPIDKAADSLAGQDFGGNPHPVVMIDEFGFDFGGQLDEKSAQILRQTKLKKPDLGLAVWQMRGPVPRVLAEAYRDTAALVMFESYVGNPRQYWYIAAQVWSARKYGLLRKAIIVLGVGKGGNPGEDWAETRGELERQMRFVRLVAPESPGIGFYSGTPELLRAADALSARFFQFPTDGRGLPVEVRDLAKSFSRRYERPTLVVSPSFVEPNYSPDGSGTLVEPKTMRAYIINLGDEDARNVKVRLRNPLRLGGNVFAEGVVPVVPKRSEVIGVLPVTGQWRVWVGQWTIELDAPLCDVLTFKTEQARQ